MGPTITLRMEQQEALVILHRRMTVDHFSTAYSHPLQPALQTQQPTESSSRSHRGHSRVQPRYRYRPAMLLSFISSVAGCSYQGSSTQEARIASWSLEPPSGYLRKNLTASTCSSKT